ncbi:hypothetical protein [Paucibacter sp. KBW04]|uniref:hypothetical protein n=1 Tax=Paucibacter sp. KBW04 TaxID=2153361 RepID=UPI000F55F365|nr:hypothetical protein [Paucibacter sp. KBW04]
MINKLGALTQVIASLRKGDATHAKPGPTGKAAEHSPRQKSQVQSPVVKGSQIESMGLRLRAIDPRDPDRRRKVLRLFVEAILLDEFGDDLLFSADFQQLVDRTLGELDAHQSSSQVLNRAFDELVR